MGLRAVMLSTGMVSDTTDTNQLSEGNGEI